VKEFVGWMNARPFQRPWGFVSYFVPRRRFKSFFVPAQVVPDGFQGHEFFRLRHLLEGERNHGTNLLADRQIISPPAFPMALAKLWLGEWGQFWGSVASHSPLRKYGKRQPAAPLGAKSL